MSKLLIAVESCQRDKALGHHEKIRITWGRQLSSTADVRFFMGGEQSDGLLSDEVWLNVPDDYLNLPLKTKAICEFMFDNGYQHVFKSDCDTTIFNGAFQRFNYQDYDYVGVFYGGKPGDQYAAASGPGYFLSRRAVEFVLQFDPSGFWAEDYMVGMALQPHIVSGKIKAFHLEDGIYAARSCDRGAPHEACPEHVPVQMKGRGYFIGSPRMVPIKAAKWLIETGHADLIPGALPAPVQISTPPQRQFSGLPGDSGKIVEPSLPPPNTGMGGGLKFSRVINGRVLVQLVQKDRKKIGKPRLMLEADACRIVAAGLAYEERVA